MTRRRTTHGEHPASVALALVVALACTASACGPSRAGTTTNGPRSSATAKLTAQQIIPAFLQCLAAHNVPVWDREQGNMSVVSLGKTVGWYVNGRVVANTAIYTYFEDLEGTYPISPDFKPDQMVGTWVDNAMSTGAWPKVCGALPTANSRTAR